MSVKVTLIVTGSVIGALVLGAAGYVGSVFLSYKRIGDKVLKVNANEAAMDAVAVDTSLTISTYNVGFGAYSQDYTFFLDEGYDANGNKTCGYYSKAKSKAEVYFNITNATKTIASLNPDFALFQEVDTDGTRSYHVNENDLILSSEAFASYENIHAVNFHSAFLPYPLYDMHGKNTAGITTLSRYKIQNAERREYTVDTSWKKIIDLDRCFSYISVRVSNSKLLYIVNSHMSAYDEGGKIKTKQMTELNTFLNQKRNEGAYVIVGGDFNQDLITFNPDYMYNKTDNRLFEETKKDPDWVKNFFNEDGTSSLTSGYRVVADDSNPSCRNNDINWVPGLTYTTVVDGFIVSDNIEVESIDNIVTTNGNEKDNDGNPVLGFANSDHEPVKMQFKLKA